MQKGTFIFRSVSLLFFFCLPFVSEGQSALQLYTPYRQISVTPGQKINYSIQLINNSSREYNALITQTGLPETWHYTLKSGSWEIGRLSVLPKEKKDISLEVIVPLKVEKGSYTFHIRAEGFSDLPLTVKVSETGTYRTSLSVDQPDLEGTSSTSFNFNGTLQNSTADTQFYALRSMAPPGWGISFNVSGKQVASAKVNPNESQNISITAKAPQQIKAGKYEIPVVASSPNGSVKVPLSVTITGTFGLQLSTPDGRLSTKITAGRSKKITLVAKNTGSTVLQDVKLTAGTPPDWEVSFDPQEIKSLEPGQETRVEATLTAGRKAISGDYVTSMKANSDEASAQADFRVSVRTSPVWGWVGVFIILIAVGAVYYLFKKYGRR